MRFVAKGKFRRNDATGGFVVQAVGVERFEPVSLGRAEGFEFSALFGGQGLHEYHLRNRARAGIAWLMAIIPCQVMTPISRSGWPGRAEPMYMSRSSSSLTPWR